MQTVTVNASKKYDVRIGTGFIDNIGEEIAPFMSGKKVMVVSDDKVFGIYGDRVVKSLEESGYTVFTSVFQNGEDSKNITNYEKLVEALFEAQLSRKDLVIAVGGGVVTDLAGFAAATYQRGIGLVMVPTTLLAAVDASVGGKNGINLLHGKNQIGTFYQPGLVLCDIETLHSLPREEYINGCAEIIKYAMIENEGLFELIRDNEIMDKYEEIITRCVTIKRDYVEADEFDVGKRMMLNFGHTIGHAVEACSGYTIPHGRAVAIGMAAITKAAVVNGYCTEDTRMQLDELLEQYNLLDELKYKAEDLMQYVKVDKKNSSGMLRIVIPKAIGSCWIKEIYKEECLKWIVLGGAR
ncbi:MAG: 3-dehydroquinate synthase [Lachnospiraceae bacterium]|nr:3-dehydroquinate synthase [Lachnospiraceae bacterium]